MKKNEYKRLCEQLNSQEDVPRIAQKTGLDRELILVLYTQKTVRRATKRFYKVKHRAKNLLKKWNEGRTFLRLSKELEFPPILTAYLILLESNITRKRFWDYVKNPDNIKDNRLRKEITEVVKNDIVYSPEGNQMQYTRGKSGEKRLCEWLDRQDLKYRTEDQLKGHYQKTPDALLSKPIKTNGMNIHWIESKASFGDEIEIRKNMKRQLKAYTELFGEGMVVYWFGFIEGVHLPKNVLIVDGSFFEKNLDAT
ncbi:MAG: TPD domain-containing protein [Methanomassiliicoccales archaeon]|nr:MAG: TPD domain-containing protein [Methanomassiliicoccales archaeon]